MTAPFTDRRDQPGRAAGGGPLSAHLTLIGGFALESGGHAAEVPPAAQRPLALLALQEHPVSRSFVAGRLWPDVPEERAAGSLRSTLWRLRRAGFDGIERHSDAIALAPWVTVDARWLVRTTTALLAGRSPAEDDAVREATAFPGHTTAAWGAELLPDWYDDWIVIERERLRQLSLHALEVLADRLIAEQRFGEAIEAALAAMRGEPFRESAHRALIRAHLAEGNHHEARRQYRICCDLLERELGVAPSHLLRALMGEAPASTGR